MNETLRTLLAAIREGRIGVDEGLRRLEHFAFEDLGFATVDHHRLLRSGFPEVVFAHGKTTEQTVAIAASLLAKEGDVLVTRVDPGTARSLLAANSGGEWNETARTVFWRRREPATNGGRVLVVSAGTSDLPVAEEAVVTARACGQHVDAVHDVGVAGLHRLLAHRDRLLHATTVIVVAGMEGALPSVVGGLIGAPVIAVPTSTGYGTSFGGVTALLSMLNSCAAGVTVVNIDNGFGAGFAAARIHRTLQPREHGEFARR
jgi:hypothetical protein